MAISRGLVELSRYIRPYGTRGDYGNRTEWVLGDGSLIQALEQIVADANAMIKTWEKRKSRSGKKD
jgi:hypothetical protein